MKETIEKLNKKSWGAFKQIALMGGYAAFGLMMLIIMRYYYRGHINYEEQLGWPEYVALIYFGIPTLLSILATFAKIPLWLWIEKIRDKFTKGDGKS